MWGNDLETVEMYNSQTINSQYTCYTFRFPKHTLQLFVIEWNI